MVTKKRVLILCDNFEQVNKIFELLTEILRESVIKRTFSHSIGEIETKEQIIEILSFNKDRLNRIRGRRYDSITNLSNINFGFLKTLKRI